VTQKFFSTQHTRLCQLTGMETAFNRFQSTTLFGLGYLATTCLRKKAWTICEFRDLQNVISGKWHDMSSSDRQNQKAV